jgi:hypothetical protein
LEYMERINKYLGVTNYSGYWWDEVKRRWGEYPDPFPVDGYVSSHCNRPKTFKAFRRHVRKIGRYLPSGIEFVLVPRYVGQAEVSLVTKKKATR